jgi:FlaG/FlaF family flagellin (archaellin)
MHHEKSAWAPLIGVVLAVAIVLTLIVVATVWEIAKEIGRTIQEKFR